jgi:DNA invertase Pin-like site-specific DNA recombinase
VQANASDSPNRKSKRRTQQDVETDLEQLRPQSEQIKTLERKLKRERAGMIGGKASGLARAPKRAEQARRRWEELGAARGSAGVIMRELLCSRSTLYRWLELGRPSDQPST